MIDTLRELASAFTTSREQVWEMAKVSFSKQVSNTLLGWFWTIAKPLSYIICFWFALYIGIKGGSDDSMNAIQYMMWLSAGVIAWFFMRDSLNHGHKLFKMYSYLVNKLKFPVSLIPVFYELSLLLVHLVLICLLTVFYFVAGGALDIYFLQIPLIMILMFLLFVGFDLLVAPLAAMSKDIGNLVKLLVTPIFWLSGILFDTTGIDNPVVQIALKLDPVAFIATSYRKVYSIAEGSACMKGWIWEDPTFFGMGVGIILLTFIAGLFVFSRLRKDLADVI